jgi:hypothetical protein
MVLQNYLEARGSLAFVVRIWDEYPEVCSAFEVLVVLRRSMKAGQAGFARTVSFFYSKK